MYDFYEFFAGGCMAGRLGGSHLLPEKKIDRSLKKMRQIIQILNYGVC